MLQLLPQAVQQAVTTSWTATLQQRQPPQVTLPYQSRSQAPFTRSHVMHDVPAVLLSSNALIRCKGALHTATRAYRQYCMELVCDDLVLLHPVWSAPDLLMLEVQNAWGV